MFDILLYLFENIVNDSAELWVDEDSLTKELKKAGFHDDDIYKALMWLEDLADLQSNDIAPFIIGQSDLTTRIYTQDESIKLDTECRGFLLFLEQINLLEVATREMVIDRVMELEESSIGLDDLKWVVLMVLFNVPGKEAAFEQMENLVFDEPEGLVH
jgi:Smg protein